ncbi:helix-turn-helix domain-containing protein [Variovorax sp. J22R133]|uniref:helix-turn-helix domain-containing protein n=1 Tax=Variovorax brevis TaxID=3053503 RepID=UPI002575AF09|nr:helix-turn-helix domain-containing protein [Variovorax sp. J22R133]MDM0115425.1 helix-turn-helix domain-containing protein [Variovorax sp. J22R133]
MNASLSISCPLPRQAVMACPGIPSGRYSNRDVRPAERFDHWHAYMAGVYDTARMPGAPGETPSEEAIESSQWIFDGLLMVSGRYADLHMSRDQRRLRADPFDHYAVLVRPSGSQRIDVDGVQTHAGAMQPVLLDMARPFSVEWDSGPGTTLYLQRAALDALLPRALDLHGVRLNGASARLLAEHLISLERHLPSMSAESAPGARRATLHLLAASLAPSVQSLGLARPASDFGLSQMMRRHVDAHLKDAQLTAEKLCRQFGVSRSTLYRIFEPMGGVSTYIKRRRLARIHAMLAQPEQRQYIGRIAQDFGFTSAAHFSRAFLEAFGYRPREAPQRACAPTSRQRAGHAWEAQGFRAWIDAMGMG